MKNACQYSKKGNTSLLSPIFVLIWGRKSPSRPQIGMILLIRPDMKKLSVFWKVFKKAAVEFDNDNGFKLAASLSYSTIFAMGPLLIVVISLAGIFLGHDAVEGRIYHQIKGLVGSSAAVQSRPCQAMIKSLERATPAARSLVDPMDVSPFESCPPSL